MILLYFALRPYRRDVVRKATSGRRDLGALMSWGPGKLLISCSKESHHPAEWAPVPPVGHLENEKDTTVTAIRVGVKILQSLFGLQLPLTVSSVVGMILWVCAQISLKWKCLKKKKIFTANLNINVSSLHMQYKMALSIRAVEYIDRLSADG